MPDLHFEVTSARMVEHCATPTLGFAMTIGCVPVEMAIQSISLSVQIRIDAPRRSYGPAEQEGMRELFGDPALWGRSLKSLLWTQVVSVVPSFSGATVYELLVPCSYDFTVAATKYFYALEQGEAPLLFLPSGSVFYRDEDGALQAAPIPWAQEATFRLPVGVWRDLMKHYHGSEAGLTLGLDVFERLRRFKVESGQPTWDRALEVLLERAQSVGGQS